MNNFSDLSVPLNSDRSTMKFRGNSTQSHIPELDSPQLESADLRSKRRQQDRFYKQKEKKAWHTRAELRRTNPEKFWSTYKPCFICMRLKGALSIPRKQKSRSNRLWTRVEHNLWPDVVQCSCCTYTFESIRQDSEDYEIEWYRKWQASKALLHEEFIEKWFEDDYKFEIVDPWVPYQQWEMSWERDAGMRAWLGCDKDDFWAPFYDEECERIQDERYRYIYEHVPGWVGEKYYDMTPVFVKSSNRRSVRWNMDDVEETSSYSVPLSPSIDWIMADDYVSDSDASFEMLSDMEESSDNDWEAVSSISEL